MNSGEPARVLAAPSASNRVDHIRVLYIDDDALLVGLVVRTLERRGFRVSGHTNQREALDKLRADPGAFDLLLTDYNMPEMSGLDVAREALAIQPTIPVVVTSGFIDDALIEQARSIGVKELISKADSAEVLCATVQGLVQQWRDSRGVVGP